MLHMLTSEILSFCNTCISMQISSSPFACGIALNKKCQRQLQGPFLTNPPQPCLSLFPEIKPCKPISCSAFPTSKFDFSGKFVSRKSVPWENTGWRVNSSKDLMGSGVCRGSSGDECIGAAAFEQESFIDASSGLQPNPNHTTGGLETIINRLSKWFVAAAFGAVILLRHDDEAIWATMGSVLNAGLSTTLKRILNQERPVSALSSSPGMPSSHAQSIFFAVVFVILSMVEWLGFNGLATILGGLVFALGSYLSWLRVSQHYHTISQVAVGAVVGSIFSILWFWTWDSIVLKAFNSFLWVRIVVVLGAAFFGLAFVLHVIRTLGCLLEDRHQKMLLKYT